MSKTPDHKINTGFFPPCPEALKQFRESFTASIDAADQLQRELRVKSAQMRLPVTRSSLDIIISVPPRIN